MEFSGNSMDRTVMKTSSLLSYLVGPREKVPGFSIIVPHIIPLVLIIKTLYGI